MKTKCRFPRLCNVLCVGTVLGLALGASAIADPSDKNVVTPAQYAPVANYRPVQKQKVLYYVKTTASAIPQPLERLGGIPTTTVPMQVIGDPRISN